MHDLVEPLLGSLTGKDRAAKQLEIVNNLVDHLQAAVKNSPVLDDDALARFVKDHDERLPGNLAGGDSISS